MPHSIIRTGRTFIFTALLAAGALAGSLTSAPAPMGDVPQGGTLFQRMDTSHTGITFGDWKRRYNGKDIDTASLSIMVQSGGIGIADIDGDSLPDLAMTTYIEGLRIYKNLGGFKFKDITDETNVSTYDCSRPTGVTYGDVDGDGDIDLFLTRWNTPNRLFINDGKGRFLDRAPESKLDFSLESVQGSLFDADGDGDLDIYVVTYGQTMKFLKQIAEMEARDK
jgi:enediyne biosynthesis protein E4